MNMRSSILSCMYVLGMSLPVLANEPVGPGGGPFTLMPKYLSDAPATRPSAPATRNAAPSKVISPEDGWLDISGFLDEAYGFVPLVIPITEPAIGYGAAAGLAFLDKPEREGQDGFGRPNITAVGGLATGNGTWGLAAGDIRHWLDDHLQTRVGLACASVNLDFAGLGKDRELNDHPLSYNLEPLGGMVEARYRLGDSPFWAGLGYTLASTDISFNREEAGSQLPEFSRESRIGGLTPSLSYDSRDNIFTPTRGTYVEAAAGLFSQALGGDNEFQRVGLIAMHFMPLGPRLFLGLRGDATFSFGDAPFYMRPFIMLRGAPAMRYQGEETAQAEAELRWQFWRRFSIVGFAGTGVAWNDFERFDSPRIVVTGGTGFRYELAHKYGLHMGMDVAFGPDGPAVYVQFGSAWARP